MSSAAATSNVSRLAMTEFRIDVLDSTVDPPQVLFAIPIKTKLLGSAEALARALYVRRHDAPGTSSGFVIMTRPSTSTAISITS